VSLTARERTRYARHLLLPEVGLSGQERLLAAQVRLAGDGHPSAVEVARTYLERAGLKVLASESEETPAVPVADVSAVERLAGHQTALLPAAAALAGALSAVEAIKEVLRLGEKGDVTLAEITMVPEDV